MDIEIACQLVSEARLSPYLHRASGDKLVALQLHQRSTELCGAMLPVTSLIEIALRNSIDLQLRHDFKSCDWLEVDGHIYWRQRERIKINEALKSSRRSKYAKLTATGRKLLSGVQHAQNHYKRSLIRQANIQVTRDDHISQFTLFFWKRLFSSEYEKNLMGAIAEKVVS
jgi:hypothetical protein